MILLGTTLSAALATCVSAQAPRSAAASSDQATSEVTVIGCLKSGDADGKVGAGSPTGGAVGAGFFLADATATPDARATQRTGMTGTGAPPSPTASATDTSALIYKLQGGDPSEFRKYLNSKVEVRGRLAGTPSSAAPTGATSGSTGSAGATGSGAAATRETGASASIPTLRVSSARQVAANCTP
jgi:hypothetical protein